MSLRRQLYEQMIRDRASEEVAADRQRRRVLALVCGLCLFWALAGSACILWSVYTTSPAYGNIARELGMLIGYGGVLVTVYGYWRWRQRTGNAE
jgi:hypothetical protein